MFYGPVEDYFNENPTQFTLINTTRTGEPDAFAAPAKYTYGNGGFDTLTADHLLQFDVTLMKAVRFTESSRLEFRASFYNVFNHPTFGKPSTNIDSSSAGQVSSTLKAARQGELALKFYF